MDMLLVLSKSRCVDDYERPVLAPDMQCEDQFLRGNVVNRRGYMNGRNSIFFVSTSTNGSSDEPQGPHKQWPAKTHTHTHTQI